MKIRSARFVSAVMAPSSGRATEMTSEIKGDERRVLELTQINGNDFVTIKVDGQNLTHVPMANVLWFTLDEKASVKPATSPQSVANQNQQKQAKA